MGAREAVTPTARVWEAWQLAREAGRERPDALAHLALRLRSEPALDALALLASGGQMRAREFAARAISDELPGSVLRSAHTPAAAAFALAIGGMGRSTEDVRAAAALYHRLIRRRVWSELAPVHHTAAGQTLFLAGDRTELPELLPLLSRAPQQILQYLRTDLQHPYLDSQTTTVDPDTTAHRQWEHALSAVFTAGGLPGIAVRPSALLEGLPGRGSGAGETSEEATHLFDLLTCAPGTSRRSDRTPGTAGQPGGLVTVIMPTFRPDAGLLTSVASMAAQTWQDLEILLVDDDSGPEYQALFDRAAAIDPRVTVIRMDRNGGSYLARNAAVEQSRGDFITVQDADDWSHPRRIEDQVRLLMEQPDAAASRSRAVRARDDLTHQWYGYRAVRDNASSLMVRRSVWDRIGPFAAIRKGADSEYAERIQAFAGSIADTGTVLAVTRLRSGSLSRGDFSYQWTHPDRLVFRGSYRALHQAAAASLAAATPAAGQPNQPTASEVVLDEDHRLHCRVPVNALRGLDGAAPRTHFARGYIADFSTEQTTPALEAEPDPTTGPVALWHLEIPEAATGARPEMHPAWFDASLAGGWVPISRLEPVTIGTIVVLDPRCLVLAADQPTEVGVDSVVIELGPGSVGLSPDGAGVDIHTAADTVRRWWGVHPIWSFAPGLDAAARASVAAALPGLDLADPVR